MVGSSSYGSLFPNQIRSATFYTYSSPPVVVHGRSRRYRNNIARPRGVHDYYNVMWDPHVFRGTTAPIVIPTTPSKSTENGEVPEGKVRNESRKKRSSSTPKSTRYKTSHIHIIQSPSHLEGPFSAYVQTEPCLEELAEECDSEETDAIVQTEPIHQIILAPSPTILKKNVYTQILPGDLPPEDIEPILEAFVEKILQQSLMETMEEEELAGLREQKNRFFEAKVKEEMEIQRLQLEQERIRAEKERLKKHLAKNRFFGENTVNGRDEEGDELIRIGGTLYTTSYLLDLLPSVLNSLRQDGAFGSQLGDPGGGSDKETPFDDESIEEKEIVGGKAGAINFINPQTPSQ